MPTPPPTPKDTYQIPYVYREKRLLIDGRSQFGSHLSNLYDVDVSNAYEVEFLVYSQTSRTIHWIKRDSGVDLQGTGRTTGTQWSSNFWIYLIIFIHAAATLIGLMHFYLMEHLPPVQDSKR